MADLISLETYKIAKALTSDKEDTRLSFIISSVSQLIKTYCNNTFLDYSQDYKEEYFTLREPVEAIQLRQTPIIDVFSVKITEYGITSELSSTEFQFDEWSDMLYRVGANWPKGVNSVQVTYTSGYTTTPKDLQLAVVDLVTYYWKDEYKANRNISSTSIQNTVTDSTRRSTEFPDHIKRVLDKYRILN